MKDGVEHLRSVVGRCFMDHMYSSAIFFSEKLVALTSDPDDIYLHAQVLFLAGHYRRSFRILNDANIACFRYLKCRYLAAKCLVELKEWDQCLSVLGSAEVDKHGNVTNSMAKHENVMDSTDKNRNVMESVDLNKISPDEDIEDEKSNIFSAIYFLRGRAYEAMENRTQARLWYKAAVKADPFCYEALERLIENHMLTCREGKSLLSSLNLSSEHGWLSSFYSCLMDKYGNADKTDAKFAEIEKASYNIFSSDKPYMNSLKNNTDILACKAESYYNCGEYRKCFDISALLLEKDPLHPKAILVHLEAAVELENSNELYVLSCTLVKDYPQKALAWFSVGCYYYCIKNYSRARLYFSKATTLDGLFSHAWIAFGNSFSAQREGDQAMSAYRTAACLFPGYHLPALYIGMEYLRTRCFKFAAQFFMQARDICRSDPLVFNELGVVSYHVKEYKRAVFWFEKTLTSVSSSLNEVWAPTVINLAHALRKLRRYHEAISYYEKALSLSAMNLSSYAGLAYTYHLQNDFGAAITYYHKALWVKPDDEFCTEMLTMAMEDECRCPPPPL